MFLILLFVLHVTGAMKHELLDGSVACNGDEATVRCRPLQLISRMGGRVEDAVRLTLKIIGGLLLALFVTVVHADYASDRAEIVNLSARYMIAMDAHDGDTYASTFTPDAVLIYGGGTLHGRDALVKEFSNPHNAQGVNIPPGATSRQRVCHSITNEVIDVHGNTATQVAYWTAMTNNSPQKSVEVVFFGHYIDHLVKVDGRWYFKKRQIFNESFPKLRALYYPELGEKDPAAQK